MIQRASRKDMRVIFHFGHNTGCHYGKFYVIAKQIRMAKKKKTLLLSMNYLCDCETDTIKITSNELGWLMRKC